MTNRYSDEFMISELHRFVNENNKTPKVYDLGIKNGYPGCSTYVAHFGSFNNSLLVADLKLNQLSIKTDKLATCDVCKKMVKELIPWKHWYYKDGKKLCSKCYSKSRRDCRNNNLDRNSSTGKGFIGQRIVATVLNIPLKHDCNCSVNFGSKYDLYHNKYGKIDVKTSKLGKNNSWTFNFRSKKDANIYICLGFDFNRKNILHVWFVPNKNKYLKTKCFLVHNKQYNSKNALLKVNHFEVNPRKYNDVLQTLNLNNCKVLKNETHIKVN